MKTMKTLFLYLSYTGAALFLLLLGAFICFAAEQPIQIEADKMTAVEKSQTVVFSGNVDATQGDVRIRSDEMTIFYIEDKLILLHLNEV